MIRSNRIRGTGAGLMIAIEETQGTEVGERFTILSEATAIADRPCGDWFADALEVDAPRRGPVAAWDDDEEESEDTDDADTDGEPYDDDADIAGDPFDDFDPEDFDDEFDDDFEDELEDEYEIEPEDDEVLEEIGAPQIKVDDGSGLATDEDDEPSVDVELPEDLEDIE